MALNYRSKLFGGGPGSSGGGVGTSSTTQVLYNNAGAVAGDAGLTYASSVLTVPGIHVYGSPFTLSLDPNGISNAAWDYSLYAGNLNLSGGKIRAGATSDAPDVAILRDSPGVWKFTDNGTGLSAAIMLIPAYANNTAAVAALGAGRLYYTDTAGEYIVKVSH